MLKETEASTKYNYNVLDEIPKLLEILNKGDDKK